MATAPYAFQVKYNEAIIDTVYGDRAKIINKGSKVVNCSKDYLNKVLVVIIFETKSNGNGLTQILNIHTSIKCYRKIKFRLKRKSIVITSKYKKGRLMIPYEELMQMEYIKFPEVFKEPEPCLTDYY